MTKNLAIGMAVCAALFGYTAFAADKPKADKPPKDGRAAAQQVRQTPEQLATRMFEEMSKHLQLTEPQKAQIQPLILERQKKLEELTQAIQKVDREASEKIREILTVDQREEYDTFRVLSRLGPNRDFRRIDHRRDARREGDREGDQDRDDRED